MKINNRALANKLQMWARIQSVVTLLSISKHSKREEQHGVANQIRVLFIRNFFLTENPSYIPPIIALCCLPFEKGVFDILYNFTQLFIYHKSEIVSNVRLSLNVKL